MKILLSIILLLFLINSGPVYAVPDTAGGVRDRTARAVDLAERTDYLLRQCELALRKSGWRTFYEDGTVGAHRFNDGYDAISIKITAGREGEKYLFTAEILKNGNRSVKTFRVSGDTAADDERLSKTVLSFVVPEALVREGNGDFRRAFKSIISFGYSRTGDDMNFYPVYMKGNIHFDWRLEYDPSSEIFSKDTVLHLGDYLYFDGFIDWASKVRENFGNIELLMFGRNRYSGSPERGTRLLYGFFNGLEYFRPGFSHSAMTWDDSIYHSRPAVQYSSWRPIQGNIILSRRNGASRYTASFMVGAGMGVGPSSLFATEISKEEEEDLNPAFKAARSWKQNYYFSYALPARLTLSADRVYDFYFELGYNYCFFYPVENETLYDMLHVSRGMIGYYIAHDVMVASQYESWWVVSMLDHDIRRHRWNRLIFEFKNFY